MNICVIGTGYVGLVTGACFAEFGVQVVCADKDAEKIAALAAGRDPDLRARPRGRGRARTCARGGSRSPPTPRRRCAASLVVFIAVPTPRSPDGSTDLSVVEAVAREIGAALDGYKVVVTKSTVPVGTAARVRGWIAGGARAAGASTSASASPRIRSSCARARRSATSCGPTAS